MIVLVVMVALASACGDCDSCCEETTTADTSAPTALVVDGDTVSDCVSGLMWLRDAGNGPMTWPDAVAWADGLTVGGFTDWRLPSGEDATGQVCNSQPSGANCLGTEFATLYFARTITALSPDPFLNVTTVYWTGTEFPDDTSKAMTQDMMDGGQNPFDKTTTKSAWAVRTNTCE